MKSVLSTLATLIFVLCLSSCSLKKLAVRSTIEIMNDGMTSFYEEEDLHLAKEAAAANIKLLEGMLKSDPENRLLLALLSRAFASYSMAFVEMRAWTLWHSNPMGYREEMRRALRLYDRGKEYGILSLPDAEGFRKSLHGGIDGFKKHLQNYRKETVPQLFWLAFNWALKINLSKDKPSAIISLPKVVALMKRLQELDEKFYYGGIHLFFGTYYAGRSKMLGGDPEKGKEHFEKALQISEKKFLLTYIFYAKFYAIQKQDKELFQNLINEVLNAPENLLPEERLVNKLSKDTAKTLARNIDDYF